MPHLTHEQIKAIRNVLHVAETCLSEFADEITLIAQEEPGFSSKLSNFHESVAAVQALLDEHSKQPFERFTVNVNGRISKVHNPTDYQQLLDQCQLNSIDLSSYRAHPVWSRHFGPSTNPTFAVGTPLSCFLAEHHPEFVKN